MADQNIVSTTFLVAAGATPATVFASNDPGGDAQGALIDNVSVTDNGPTVPEPGSASLVMIVLALGVAGSAGLRETAHNKRFP